MKNLNAAMTIAAMAGLAGNSNPVKGSYDRKPNKVNFEKRKAKRKQQKASRKRNRAA